MTKSARAETFPALGALPGVVHAFTLRMPGVDVKVDREEALRRLDTVHADVRRELGLDPRLFVTARQVHGKEVAVVDSSTRECVPDVDGLITADPGVCLGIYVADCCAVYLVDPRRRVAALLHAGRKGAEQGIAPAAVERMQAEFGCDPADLVAQLSPCIRPPHFETDFAALIVSQLQQAGVREIHDSGICTASHPERYYSYRRELGRTGRMLALLALPQS
ncbi:MAG TPA: polyphenol oxidase family protein [Chthoniobacteraceae bacterium]|nr:polyphenol oxidase family protein [Chthoniobacteraceae bacterium]